MQLLVPSAQWRTAFVDMAREWVATGDRRYTLATWRFDAYLRRLEAWQRADNLPAGGVPYVERWLEHEDHIVACARIRLALTPALEHEGGHIGYDVRPSMRRRGFGTALLGLALVEARARGLTRIRVTCDDDNLGSIKIIERNGGVLDRRVVSFDSGLTIRQYWIG